MALIAASRTAVDSSASESTSWSAKRSSPNLPISETAFWRMTGSLSFDASSSSS